MSDIPENHDSNGKPDALGNEPDGYKVGYGRPPKQWQWKKGQRGNNSGRRKRKPESYGELLDKILNETVFGQENGKTVSMTRRKAWVSGLVNNAIDGVPLAERILMMFERPDFAPTGGGAEIIDVDSEDEIPRHRAQSLARKRRKSAAHRGPVEQRRPRGRPRHDEPFAVLIRRELDKRIKVQVDGKTITMTKREAWMRRMVNGAIACHHGSLRTFLQIVKPTAPPPGDGPKFYIVGGR